MGRCNQKLAVAAVAAAAAAAVVVAVVPAGVQE